MNNLRLKPIKFACIAPIHLLSLIPKSYDFHLLLAHLLEDPDYVAFYKARKLAGDTLLLDNGAFEFGKPLEAEDILELIDKSGIQPDYVVAPDYPTKDWKRTVDSSLNFANKVRDHAFKVMAVPQSVVGDAEGWLEGYQALVKHMDIDMIGMSILAIPNAFQKITGTTDIMINRLFATSEILNNKLQIAHYTAESGPIKPVTKWHHYLGLGQPRELLLQRQLGLMDSNDSSSPVWHGVQGIKYDDSYGGLINGKSPIPVDFHATRFGGMVGDVYFTDEEIAKCISYNMKSIDKFATKDCSQVDITSLEGLKNLVAVEAPPANSGNLTRLQAMSITQAHNIAAKVKGSLQRADLVKKVVQ